MPSFSLRKLRSRSTSRTRTKRLHDNDQAATSSRNNGGGVAGNSRSNSLPTNKSAKTKSITKEEIDLVLGDNYLPILDKLVDSVFRGKIETIGPLLKKIRAEGIQPIVIIRYFQSHVKILITIGAKKQKGLSIQAAVNSIRPPIYFKRKQSVINHSKLYKLNPETKT